MGSLAVKDLNESTEEIANLDARRFANYLDDIRGKAGKPLTSYKDMTPVAGSKILSVSNKALVWTQEYSGSLVKIYKKTVGGSVQSITLTKEEIKHIK